MLMGVLTLGSAHARPSARPPIDLSLAHLRPSLYFYFYQPYSPSASHTIDCPYAEPLIPVESKKVAVYHAANYDLDGLFENI